ncbi:MAG: phosphoadenosine phosphosulfate reductase domain-containing protein [Lutibacter sp.]
MNSFNLKESNKLLRNKTPEEIVSWAMNFAKRPVITTNFRPYEAAILHLCTKKMPELKVIWCDTGYNTPNTYKHAFKLIEQLKLNIKLYTPKQTVAYRNVVMGIPEVGSTLHKEFSYQVKIEPFQRAMTEHQPDVWFTNLRNGQTAFRDSIDILSLSKDGILKVSPFYYFSDKELDNYLSANNLPNEFKYFDPTKALEHRECGIHF